MCNVVAENLLFFGCRVHVDRGRSPESLPEVVSADCSSVFSRIAATE